MDFIYPVSYLLSLTGLVGWFVFQGNKALSGRLSAMFLIGFLVYLLALTFAQADFNYKLLILFRDLVVLGIVSQVFNVFKSSKIAAIGLGALAAAIVYFSYFNLLLCTFPQLPTDRLWVDGEFLVHIHPAASDQIDEWSSKMELSFTQAFNPARPDATDLDEYYVVNVIPNTRFAVKRVFRQLGRKAGIQWIEPNEVYTLDLPDSSPAEEVSRTHILNDPGIKFQWAYDPLNMDALHELLLKSGITPRKKSLIAIVDSGVESAHEDLAGNYSPLEAEGSKDNNGHGTHCAGVASAVSNNGKGIAAFAPNDTYVEVTGIKVVNAFGFATQEAVIRGILRAVDGGADVISLSLGGPTQRKKEIAYRDAIDYALVQGAIVVVAAGNDNSNATGITPANINGVIAVAAADKQNKKAFFSNTVQDLNMAVCAPGVDIYSTYRDNSYKTLSGTSMAAPFVSGTIGLMRSIYPELTAEEAFYILDRTGVKTSNTNLTGKLIQPYEAVSSLVD